MREIPQCTDKYDISRGGVASAVIHLGWNGYVTLLEQTRKNMVGSYYMTCMTIKEGYC